MSIYEKALINTIKHCKEALIDTSLRGQFNLALRYELELRDLEIQLKILRGQL